MYKKYEIENFSSSDSISPSPSPGGNTFRSFYKIIKELMKKMMLFIKENIDLKNDTNELNETIENNEKRIKQLENEAVKYEERISS